MGLASLSPQLWRALRMIVDTGLHYKGLKRDEALHMFQKYLWDDSDIALKEVTRYQSAPGQATAYMIGQMHIIKLREYAKEKREALAQKQQNEIESLENLYPF